MENATKALLIAAAVLITILIISLGVIIYNRASQAVDGVGDLSEYEIQQFNEKFTKYESASASGSDVNALLTTVFNHNNSQADNSSCVQVDYTDNAGATTTIVSKVNNATSTPSKVSTGSRYSIECTIDANTKLVNKVTVKVN